jgi:uncharacterized protein
VFAASFAIFFNFALYIYHFINLLFTKTIMFEVGGAAKTNEQIRGIPNAYLVLDIEGGNNNSIPLWMFGMLY